MLASGKADRKRLPAAERPAPAAARGNLVAPANDTKTTLAELSWPGAGSRRGYPWTAISSTTSAPTRC